MGMDVYGRAPTAPEGEYFRRNVWRWHPLAALVETLCPDEAAPCKGWHYNGGDGLDAVGAATLATSLEARRTSGSVAALCTQHDAWLAALPRVKCFRCGGTGDDGDGPQPIKVEAPGLDDVFGPSVPPQPGAPCRLCNGEGTFEDWAKAYRLDSSDVDEFIAFLQASGGFSIG
jgi:hypothetical protein